jgi:hypothetical protein
MQRIVGVVVAFVSAMALSTSVSPDATGDPGICGAHQGPIDCAEAGSPTAGESAFIARVRGSVPGSDVQLLKIVRGTCFYVRQGEVTTNGMVQDIAEHTGQSQEGAGQVLAAAMDTACPGYTVAANGTTIPAGSTGPVASGAGNAPSGSGRHPTYADGDAFAEEVYDYGILQDRGRAYLNQILANICDHASEGLSKNSIVQLYMNGYGLSQQDATWLVETAQPKCG